MEAYGVVDVYIHIFLTSALVGREWSASRSCRFTLGERSLGNHCIEGWIVPIASLDDVKKRKVVTLPEGHREPRCGRVGNLGVVIGTSKDSR
jgi:hypothetical protein